MDKSDVPSDLSFFSHWLRIAPEGMLGPPRWERATGARKASQYMLTTELLAMKTCPGAGGRGKVEGVRMEGGIEGSISRTREANSGVEWGSEGRAARARKFEGRRRAAERFSRGEEGGGRGIGGGGGGGDGEEEGEEGGGEGEDEDDDDDKK